MICPACGGKMEHGEVAVLGSMTGFLIFGLSHKNLYWLPAEGRSRWRTPRRELVVQNNRAVDARRCEACGTVVIPTDARGGS